MVEYDSSVIQQMADGLYAQARKIEILWALMGALILGAAGGAGAAVIDGDAAIIGLVAGAVVGGYGGFLQGRSRAFLLRLQAQTALCQVRIERNTAGAIEPAAR